MELTDATGFATVLISNVIANHASTPRLTMRFEPSSEMQFQGIIFGGVSASLPSRLDSTEWRSGSSEGHPSAIFPLVIADVWLPGRPAVL
jgi:hypothetical protein